MGVHDVPDQRASEHTSMGLARFCFVQLFGLQPAASQQSPSATALNQLGAGSNHCSFKPAATVGRTNEA